MSGLSTAAWVGHDLGLATSVGGVLFGRMALHPATRKLPNDAERGLVIGDAWRRFSLMQVAGSTIAALTWFAGRSRLSGWEVDRASRALTPIKDAFVVGTLGTSIASALLGRRLQALAPDGALPVSEDGRHLAAEAPAQAKRLNAVVDKVGIASLAFGAGVVALTAVLAMRAGQSGRWALFSRFLP
jgi:hypothetical protein